MQNYCGLNSIVYKLSAANYFNFAVLQEKVSFTNSFFFGLSKILS